MMLRSSTPRALFGYKPKAFTLVEVMVVVVIIGFLAAAGLPGYRHLTMRSKATAIENDLRQFSTAAQTYALQNGHWPADSDPQVVPPELANALPNNFTLKTPIGGVYKWCNNGSDVEGAAGKVGIAIVSVTGNPLNDDLDLIRMIDRQMDDGNEETGMIQGNFGTLSYVVEK
jgi:prepilin-type N-terminal cleavage/methylation domain-containing protein